MGEVGGNTLEVFENNFGDMMKIYNDNIELFRSYYGDKFLIDLLTVARMVYNKSVNRKNEQKAASKNS